MIKRESVQQVDWRVETTIASALSCRTDTGDHAALSQGKRRSSQLMWRPASDISVIQLDALAMFSELSAMPTSTMPRL